MQPPRKSGHGKCLALFRGDYSCTLITEGINPFRMKKVLINVEDRELRVAILEDDQLVELFTESLDEKSILNNIYKGRVEGVIPGLKAAFVNIGLDRNAFLHFDDVRTDLLAEPVKVAAQAPIQEVAEEEVLPVEAQVEVEAATVETVEVAVPEAEYQPSAEELAAVEALAKAPEPVAAEGVAPQGAPDGQHGDQGDARHRRRRGRRGGRRRRRNRDGQEIPQRQGGPPSGPQDDGGGQPPPRAEVKPEGDKDRTGNVRPPEERRHHAHPSQLPPPAAARAPRGSRAATNPYDVFSPYSRPAPQPGRRRRGGAPSALPWEAPIAAPAGPAKGESQEDFFGPTRVGGVVPEEDDFYEEDDGPAPGNERFPEPGAKPDSAQNKGKKRGRGPRRRNMRSRGGSSFYAARRKPEPGEVEPAKAEASEAAPARKAKAKAKPAQAPEAPAEKPVVAKAKAPRTSKAAAAPAAAKPAASKAAKPAPAKPVAAKAAEVKPVAVKPAPAPKAAKAPVARKAKPEAKAAAPVAAPVVEAAPAPAPKKKQPAKAAPAEKPQKAAKTAAGGQKKVVAAEVVAEKPVEVAVPAEPKALAETPKKSPRARKAVAAPKAPPVAEAPVETKQPEPPPAPVPPPAPEPEAVAAPEQKVAQEPSAPRPGRSRRRGQGRDRRPSGARPAETQPEAIPTTGAAEESVSAEPVAASETAAVAETSSEGAAQPPAAPERHGRDQHRRDRRERRERRDHRDRPGREQRAEQREPRPEHPAEQRPQHPEQREPRPEPREPRPERRPFVRRRPVMEVLKKGDEILVQVIKEEIGLKGARISTYVSIPGRFLVLLPYPNEEGGVSKKVENFQERKRLKKLLRDISSDDMGFIVRTAGVDREEGEIRNDVEFLTQEWDRVKKRYDKSVPTELVYNDHDILYRLARDVFDDSVSEILIDSRSEADKLRDILRQLIPSLVDKVKVYDEAENIFLKHQVEKQIQKAARRKVWLKSGGYIIIDEAEALTAIDVNSGKFVGKDDQEKMILKTNMEASKTIAREIKLRDIGGLIVIDFIDMRDQRNRDMLLNEFRALLKRDRSKTSVSSVSEFGLVEMTRKRVRQSLKKTLFTDCPYCQGAGVVLNERQIWMHIKHEMIKILEGASPAPSLNIITNPKIRAYIEQHYRETLQRLEQKYGCDIRISMSDVFHVENYAVERVTRTGERVALPVGIEADSHDH